MNEEKRQRLEQSLSLIVPQIETYPLRLDKCVRNGKWKPKGALDFRDTLARANIQCAIENPDNWHKNFTESVSMAEPVIWRTNCTTLVYEQWKSGVFNEATHYRKPIFPQFQLWLPDRNSIQCIPSAVEKHFPFDRELWEFHDLNLAYVIGKDDPTDSRIDRRDIMALVVQAKPEYVRFLISLLSKDLESLMFIVAGQFFMQEKLIKRTRKDPNTKRLLGESEYRPKEVSSVSVCTLRHEDQDFDGNGDRSYSHRWWVRGHVRMQACGKNLSERRPVWIDPHIKGPEDAPLVEKDHVSVVQR